jgi:hypothetical protein
MLPTDNNDLTSEDLGVWPLRRGLQQASVTQSRFIRFGRRPFVFFANQVGSMRPGQ